MMTRRQAIKTTALGSAAIAALPGAIGQTNPVQTSASQPGRFTLPSLPYSADALEPYLDARTMEIHHDKHHAAYVANLNKAIYEVGSSLEGLAIEDILRDLNRVPESIRATVRNNGGGHHNHSLFWQMMRRAGGEDPSTGLDYAMTKDFGGFVAFKDRFTEAAKQVFGSGWTWLVLDGRELKIVTTANQDTPLSAGKTPLLGLDVWEHAYYLKYQNKRADYISAWWNVVNWAFVAERYEKFKA